MNPTVEYNLKSSDPVNPVSEIQNPVGEIWNTEYDPESSKSNLESGKWNPEFAGMNDPEFAGMNDPELCEQCTSESSKWDQNCSQFPGCLIQCGTSLSFNI